MNTNNVSYRLTQIIEHFADGNEKRFAESIGVKPAVINNYTKGKQQSKPGFEVLHKIIEAYPEVNIEWLLNGKGEMLKGRKKGVTEKIIVATQDTKGNVTVPLINRKAAANYLSGHQTQEYFEELDALILPNSLVSGKQYCAIQVSGDSMKPTLQDGDYVLCYRCDRQEWENLSDGEVCVIVSVTNGVQIKRIKNKLNENFLTCESDNYKKHPPFDLAHEDIAEIWRATWKLSSSLEDEVSLTLNSKVSELEARIERIERMK